MRRALVCLLVACLFAAAVATEWDVLASPSTASNPETIVVVHPHAPIAVRPHSVVTLDPLRHLNCRPHSTFPPVSPPFFPLSQVEAVLPPAEKVFNASKTTPGAQCSDQQDCSACIGLHHCLWTKSNKCINSGTAEALRLQFRRFAFAVCLNVDGRYNRTTVEVKDHFVMTAKIAPPTPLAPTIDLHGVPVRIPAQPQVVYPVNAIRTPASLASLESIQKNRNVFEAN